MLFCKALKLLNTAYNYNTGIQCFFEVAIVPAAVNILSVLLFRQSTRLLTIKHTSCMLCPEYSTLGHTSSRLPRVFDFRKHV